MRALTGLVLVVALAVALSLAAIELLPATLYFPAVRFEAPGGLSIGFLQPGQRGGERCATKAEEIAAALREHCPSCVVDAGCERGLTDEQRSLLSRSPLPVSSAARADGALKLTFHAADAALAESVCRESAKASQALPAAQRLRCYAAGERR